jgi:hypothetical protein
MSRECSRHEKYQNCIQNLVGKSEGNRTLAELRHGWDDNITRTSGKN